MIRYCGKCKKGFEFTIKNMSDMDNLICPQCGSHINKDSRTMPGQKREEDQAEAIVGGLFYYIFKFRYYFFALMAAIGVVAYFVSLYKLMVVMTGICIVALCFRTLSGRSSVAVNMGILGAGIAFCWYFIDKSFNGICLGILFGFLIRFIIKDILYTLLFRLITASR